MGIEIERKFLLAGDGWRGRVERTQRMAQGYLNDHASVVSGAQQVSVRVRLAGEAAWINIKSREAGPSRQEFEYAVPAADGEALLALCTGARIDKVRHYVTHEGWLWEIDEFAGDNAGLVVAEIELPRADAQFPRPAWIGAEVTDRVRYYNRALAARPFRAWTEQERQGC